MLFLSSVSQEYTHSSTIYLLSYFTLRGRSSQVEVVVFLRMETPVSSECGSALSPEVL